LQSTICSLELEADVSEIREKIRDKTSAPNWEFNIKKVLDNSFY
jgi:hypothetical protein